MVEIRIKRKQWWTSPVTNKFGWSTVAEQRKTKDVLEYKDKDGWHEVPIEYEYHDFD